MAGRGGGVGARTAGSGRTGAARVAWAPLSPSEFGDQLADLTPAVQRATGDTFLRVGPRVGRAMVQSGAAAMPNRNGLAARVRQTRVRTTRRGAFGRTARVDVELVSPSKIDLARLDAGTLRHPVWGRRGRWVSQTVPRDAFSRPARAAMPLLRTELARSITATINRNI